jgi:isopenicillin-N N-acyltransferase-like protein
MRDRIGRREFLARAAGGAALALTGRFAWGQEQPKAADPALTVISGKPRERGRQYGQKFKDAIRGFLDREIYQAFKKYTPEEALRYAGACGKKIRAYSSSLGEELEGMAEGSGLRAEEVILITLHEELYHKGVLPAVDHCTAFAAGPPDTQDGNTYVGQTWDWMTSVYGLSSMLLWKRPEGPSLLAYAYPGLWVGAGLNSAGISLCWTSGGGMGIAGPRVGIPAYVLIAQMLYQPTLKGAIEEARRAGHAGWFTFVLADGEGNLANVEGTPERLVVESGRGAMARVGYGSREMTGTAEGQPVKFHPQAQRMLDLLAGSRGKIDRAALQGFCGDHQSTICKHFSTIDAMLFNNTKREAYVSRGPGCSGRWKTFRFEED